MTNRSSPSSSGGNISTIGVSVLSACDMGLLHVACQGCDGCLPHPSQPALSRLLTGFVERQDVACRWIGDGVDQPSETHQRIPLFVVELVAVIDTTNASNLVRYDTFPNVGEHASTRHKRSGGSS